MCIKTDALVSKKVKIAAEANQDMHSPIIYPVGIVKGTEHLEEAKSFFQFLQSKAAKSIFKKYGFQVT
ncbi:molybdenum ABC transporter molybdate-binding protein [Bacillus sp. TBS-096]|nr:molybdenum ABC transporter molybdate-binding protein [Bacillus sp. TBS-096]